MSYGCKKPPHWTFELGPSSWQPDVLPLRYNAIDFQSLTIALSNNSEPEQLLIQNESNLDRSKIKNKSLKSHKKSKNIPEQKRQAKNLQKLCSRAINHNLILLEDNVFKIPLHKITEINYQFLNLDIKPSNFTIDEIKINLFLFVY